MSHQRLSSDKPPGLWKGVSPSKLAEKLSSGPFSQTEIHPRERTELAGCPSVTSAPSCNPDPGKGHQEEGEAV